MEVRENAAKQRLLRSEPILTSAVRLPEPGLCEILGYAGFDFVLLDGEHGAIDSSAIDRLSVACWAGGTVPIVRVLHNDDAPAIMHALDLGAQGVLIPHCRSADDARRMKSAALYPPDGNRGFGPGREAGWGRVSQSDYFAAVNEQILLIGLIEDLEGLENIEEIAKEGLDILWVGTGDLSMALGVPGDRDHERVREATQRILEACERHGVAAGYPARSAEDARSALEQGFLAVGFGGAEHYVMAHARQYLGQVRPESEQ